MSDKKTWIKIHSGLNKPKHRKKMGNKRWFFDHLVENADWETGRVEGYTDGKAAKEMEAPEATVRKWRTGLRDEDYITCLPAFQSQTIIIHKWRNPRLVNAPQINIKGECPKMDAHSGVKMDTHPLANLDTPTIDHNSSDSSSQERKTIFTLYETILGLMVASDWQRQDLEEVEATYPIEWIEEVFKKSIHARNKLKYAKSILLDWKDNGKPLTYQEEKETTKPDDPVRAELEEALYGDD
jgi:hypothetical protein